MLITYLASLVVKEEKIECLNLLESKKDILTSFKRPKWLIIPKKRLHLKCCLFFENNK